MTELLFNNVFNDLSPAQCCALLSCFVFQERASEMPKLSEELSGPLRLMQVKKFFCKTNDLSHILTEKVCLFRP